MKTINLKKELSANGYKAALEQAEKRIRRIRDGKVVFTVLRHCSASGLSRSISLYYIDKTGYPELLDRDAALILDMPLDADHEGILVKGAGMDMGFWLVDALFKAVGRDSKNIKQMWL